MLGSKLIAETKLWNKSQTETRDNTIFEESASKFRLITSAFRHDTSSKPLQGSSTSSQSSNYFTEKDIDCIETIV